MFTTVYGGPYQPLTWLSFAFDNAVWGLDPQGFHLTNLIIHTANAVLFYLISARLLKLAITDPPEASQTNLHIAAGFSALTFAIHPLRVESVAWLTERRDVLSGFFYLLAVLSYLGDGKQKRVRGTLIVLFICALLSKAIVITLPLVLLILDVYPLRRLSLNPMDWGSTQPRAVLSEKVPLLSLALLFGLIGLFGQKAFGNMPSIEHYGWLQRTAQVFFGAMFYLQKTVLPHPLLPLYERPEPLNPFAWTFVMSAALVIALTSAAVALRRTRPWLTVVWAYYVVTLAPVLGLVTFGPQLAADRYTYLPSMSICLLFGAGLWQLLLRPHIRTTGITAALLIITCLGAKTWAQSKLWKDDVTLWRHTLEANPDSVLINYNLGTSLMKQERWEDAKIYFERSIELRPHELNQRYNLGIVLKNQGELESSLTVMRDVIKINPHFAPAHHTIATILERRGAKAEAARHYLDAAKSVEFKKDYFRAGKLLIHLKRNDEAIAAYHQGLSALPDDALAMNDLGSILASKGNLSEATPLFERAASQLPQSALIHVNLASAYRLLGKYDQAIAEYTLALQLAPDNLSYRQALAQTQALRSREKR